MKQVNLNRLYDLAGNKALELEEGFYTLRKLLEKNFNLMVFLENSLIPKEQKKKLLKDLLKSPPKFLIELINLLIDEELEKEIIKLSHEFSELVSKKQKIKLVEVTTAFPLEDSEKKGIESLLKEKSLLRLQLDPSLLGGFKLKVAGGLSLDASLKGKLNKLREDLINA